MILLLFFYIFCDKMSEKDTSFEWLLIHSHKEAVQLYEKPVYTYF